MLVRHSRLQNQLTKRQPTCVPRGVRCFGTASAVRTPTPQILRGVIHISCATYTTGTRGLRGAYGETGEESVVESTL